MKNNTFLAVIVVALLLACITDLSIINQLINVYDVQPLTIELYQLRSDAMMLNIGMLSFFIIITYVLVEILWNRLYIKRKDSRLGKRVTREMGKLIENLTEILNTKDEDVLNPKSNDTLKDSHTNRYPKFDKVARPYGALLNHKPNRADYLLSEVGEMDYAQQYSRWWNSLSTEERELIKKNKKD